MSQQASIGKPPERQRPPSTFQGGMRRIIYVEQPQEEAPQQPQPPPIEQKGKLIAYLSKLGYLSGVPAGSTIGNITKTDEGYSIAYSTPSHEALFSFRGEKLSGKEIALIGKQTPEGFEAASVKREGDVLNIVYQERQAPQPQGQPFMGLIGVEHGGLIQAAMEAPSFAELSKQMQADMSGRAYPWTALDVYNIASTAILVGTAVKTVASIPAIRMQLPSSVRQALAPKMEIYEDIGMSQQYAAMDVDVASSMNVRVEQFVKSHYIGKGTPITPMSRTLELARGGLLQEAEQYVIFEPTVQPNLRTYLPSFQTFMTTAKTPSFLPMPVIVPLTRQTQRLQPATKAATLAGVSMLTGTSQAQLTMTRQSLATLQTQGTQQIQALRQMQLQRQMQITRQHEMPYDFGLPKAMGKRGMKQFGLWGRYKRFYPVATAQEVLRMKKRKFL